MTSPAGQCWCWPGRDPLLVSSLLSSGQLGDTAAASTTARSVCAKPFKSLANSRYLVTIRKLSDSFRFYTSHQTTCKIVLQMFEASSVKTRLTPCDETAVRFKRHFCGDLGSRIQQAEVALFPVTTSPRRHQSSVTARARGEHVPSPRSPGPGPD